MIINEAVVRDVIRTDKTGTSFYDNFLDKKDNDYMKLAKGLDGKIVKMTPQHYLDELPKIFHCSKEQALRGVDDADTATYMDMMSKGTKFNLPYLNYASDQQEGRHRALAAYKLGVPTISVLVVTKWDRDKELDIPKGSTIDLWYGHTIEWTDKDGHPHSDHVGMDVNAIKKRIAEIKRSGNYK